MQDERRQEIVKLISENRMVKASELVERYHVSMETIRRDMEYLEEKGYLTRVYGGAVARTMYGLEPEYSAREVKNYQEKLLIGRAAVDLVEDGDTILMDVGTTMLEFARFLKGHRRVTVFTNAMQIAMALVMDTNIRVIQLGGNVRPGELATSGFIAEDTVGRFCFDKAFLGVGGLTMDKGITDYHMEEANLRRHFVENAQKVIALADYSKFGIKAMNRVCDIKQVDIIVTDKRADKNIINEFRGLGKSVIIAE